MDDRGTLHWLRDVQAKAREYRVAWSLIPSGQPEDWHLDARDALEVATLALARALDPAVEVETPDLRRALDELRASVHDHLAAFEADERPAYDVGLVGRVGTALKVLGRHVARLRRELPGGMRAATGRRSPRLSVERFCDALGMDPRKFKKDAEAKWGLQRHGAQEWTVNLDLMDPADATAVEREARRARRK